MESNLKIEKAEIGESDIKYRNLICALLYISSSTRPDISYSINYLSRYQNSYETHWKYALRILKYLYLTEDLKISYIRNVNCETIDWCVDADWAGDNVDRKSTSGYVIKVFGNVIDWKSRKQKTVTKVKIFEDNSGAINIANYGNFTKNSKHIEIHYHYVHESVKENEIVLIKIDSNDNIADIFTKALCKDKFEKFRKLLNIM